jgi:hypothetical protein
MIHATTDEPTEIVNDTVYQVRKPDGSFVPRYVRVTKTYGEGLEPGAVEGEVVLDRENPGAVGRTVQVVKSMLAEPDTYPSAMFKPETWVAKATQTEDQLRTEVMAFVDGWMATEGLILTAGVDVTDEVGKVMEALKIALQGFFGGFTLAVVLHWLKDKIDSSLAARGGAGRTVLPFERKLGTMKQALKAREQNLKTPVEDRGRYNAKFPFGAPREVQPFSRPTLSGG